MKSSTGFCTYSDVLSSSSHPTIHGFVSDSDMCKTFFGKPPYQHAAASDPSSSSKTMKEFFSTTINFYHHHQHQQDFVSSTNSRDHGLYGKYSTMNNDSQEEHQMLQDGVNLDEGAAGHNNFLQFNNSKFLVPVQELLNEFCSLGPTQINNDVIIKQKSHKNRELEQNGVVSSNKKQHSVIISSIEFVELQRRKTKLLSMLEELERRYRHYSNQMKELVSSFEAVAGYGAATVYSALAMKAMSRHFRCLKDEILDQIEYTRKAMGEKADAGVTTTKGETPRLRVIDQSLRQQRALQQINMMETQPWRPQRGLPERSVSILRAWLFEHFLHPYPSDVDKHILARQAGLSRSQVGFIWLGIYVLPHTPDILIHTHTH